MTADYFNCSKIQSSFKYDELNFPNSGVCKIIFDEVERSLEISFKKQKEKIFFDQNANEVLFFSHKVLINK
jgi:hypothetical protein